MIQNREAVCVSCVLCDVCVCWVCVHCVGGDDGGGDAVRVCVEVTRLLGL